MSLVGEAVDELELLGARLQAGSAVCSRRVATGGAKPSAVIDSCQTAKSMAPCRELTARGGWVRRMALPAVAG